MVKQILGFRIEEDKTTEKTDTNSPIKNMERDFQSMITFLRLEDEHYLKEINIERKIRNELIKIYKQMRKMEKKIIERNKLMVQCQAFTIDYPKKSLELLTKIGELDMQIIPECQLLSKEISKHCLPDIADLYKEMDLSTEQIKQIRNLAFMLNSSLGSMANPISQSVQSQQIESIRREIITRNPNLK